jgi:hypothetical protein
MFGTRSAEGELAVGRSLAHRDADVSASEDQCARVSDRRDSLPPPRSSRCVAAADGAHPMDCYGNKLSPISGSFMSSTHFSFESALGRLEFPSRQRVVQLECPAQCIDG